MKNKLGLIFPLLMLSLGAYTLITAVGVSGEQVTLVSDHAIPRGLAMMFGLICLVGGGGITISILFSKKNASVVTE
ncbi:MAG: hypothetical protein HOP18_17160 [Deltaproteobacteria bacterium]|nr:hypothetical protein [Deltaproteobacteria bacterium]